ncbi:MAG: hypothetical protein ACRD12_05720 [Acidimicrobiales bacterium]
MPLFAKKFSLDEIQREAAAELDSAVARAKPPTEAERTWVLPMPETPNLRPAPRPRTARRPRIVWDEPEEPMEAAPAAPPPKAKAKATATRRKPPARSAGAQPAARKAPSKTAKPAATKTTSRTKAPAAARAKAPAPLRRAKRPS